MDEKEYREYMLVQKIFAGLFIAAAGYVCLYGLYIIGKGIYGCFGNREEVRVTPAVPQDVVSVSISSETENTISISGSVLAGDNVDSAEIA